MYRWMGGVMIFLAGLLTGAAAVAGSYLYLHRDTVIFTTVQELRADGIVIPAGTELVHDTAMPEGFDTLRLYVSVDPATLSTSFSKRVDDRPFLVIPYQAGQGRSR